MGQPYIGRSKKEEVIKEPLVVGSRCKSAACVKSSKHHCSKIGEADRETIFKCFWETMNWEEKIMCVWFGRCHLSTGEKIQEGYLLLLSF